MSYSFQGLNRVWTPRDEEENRAIFSSHRKETGISMPHEFKPVYLANREYEIEKWSVKRLIYLLRLYGAHRCLWDIKDPDYRSRELRNAAFVDITAALGEGVRQEQVVQKINVLRATYRYEKRRIKRRMREGVGAQTKLKWFALADAFLRNVPRTDKSRKNQDDSDSDLEDAIVFTVDPETIVPSEEERHPLGQNVKKEIMETDESDDDYAYHMQSPVKHEFASMKATYSTKTTWTAQHSLLFVELLKDYPTLWNGQQPNDPNELTALTAIADQMQWPLKSIKKRVNTFRRVLSMEQSKILQNVNYTPDYVWWPLAVNFLSAQVVHHKELEHFVDANKMPPATPLDTHQDIDMLRNPIPSVMTAMAEEPSLSFCAQASGGIAPEVTTKLILNGLEDDLLEGKWSLKHSVKFLRLYGAHRCLWDLNDPDYRSRELRAAAIEDMAAAMGRLNADFVAKKIKIFRITYMQHRKRMLAAIKQGKEPEIQLRWFPLADCFLRPHIGLRCIRERECEVPQFDYQYVQANLNLIDPALLTDFRGKGTQNTIEIGAVEEADALAAADTRRGSTVCL